MSFGSDLDLDGFTRAFADDDIRPLLGLDITPSAAAKISNDPALVRSVYVQWQRGQQPTPFQQPAVSEGGHRLASDTETGLWAAIFGALMLLAAWVAMAVGFTVADAHRQDYLTYGQQSFLIAGDSLVWAGCFTAAALIFAWVATSRGHRRRRRFSHIAGIVELVGVVLVTVVIIFNAVEIHTWMR